MACARGLAGMTLEQQAWGIWTAIAGQATQAVLGIGNSNNATWRTTAKDFLSDLQSIGDAVAEAVADQNRTEHADQR